MSCRTSLAEEDEDSSGSDIDGTDGVGLLFLGKSSSGRLIVGTGILGPSSSSGRNIVGILGILLILDEVEGGVGVVTSPITGGGGGCI